MPEGQEPEGTPLNGQEPGSDGGEPKTFDADYVSKIRGQAASYRTQVKELESRLKQFENSQTDSQKLADRLTAAEQRAANAEQQAMRFSVATRKGLPAELAARLQGSSEQEMEADADALLALVRPAGNGGFDGGAGDPALPQDMDALIRRAAGRRV